MSTKMDIENQNSRLLSYGLLAGNIVLLIITIILFIKFPPPVDIYNDYDYVDVIFTKVFVLTLILYAVSTMLMMINVIRPFTIKGRGSMGLIITRILMLLIFVGVTFYLLGYLGFYETFDINFIMPFRDYHPPF
ncbi:hypothetical protein MMG00_10295 [Ignatzschineria rhizosphaerae]|uniref:Uncharacterized protein n=1 Tax=Ignatzschineria rhizosphaerae TaxID=2923279 RepID=A0ABY3X144_9GAMM|nr:hypothetical protein [Ignatzschineria rhizosphaerae]UNM95605.1 hypothetical protein MMG00_10295 [Ignatzschineria rhizosphaerae]